ncbi:hypothetical protein [Thermoflexibacter ruber]|uniref:Uncharacterized protein n=1 Tax=Thermoflexibacter ruber TaxID=1003 RepID=A0A1I2BUF5_9BACT|nr:hypothetical protein [Thermoflexibacter ruber]SFE59742.1 hypothetical protein SAMN04488541_1003160 [Thermoflexibacter ruber]
MNPSVILFLSVITFLFFIAFLSGFNAIKIAWQECIKAGNSKQFFKILNKNMFGLKYVLLLVSIVSVFVWIVLEIKLAKASKKNNH